MVNEKLQSKIIKFLIDSKKIESGEEEIEYVDEALSLMNTIIEEFGDNVGFITADPDGGTVYLQAECEIDGKYIIIDCDVDYRNMNELAYEYVRLNEEATEREKIAKLMPSPEVLKKLVKMHQFLVEQKAMSDFNKGKLEVLEILFANEEK